MKTERKPYVPQLLPLDDLIIRKDLFYDELIDASAKLEVYKEKINDSKLDKNWFMPTLQQKEVLASSKMEGTQATIDGVLVNQITPNNKDIDLIEVANYYQATNYGYNYLSQNGFDYKLILNLHSNLMNGVRRTNTDEIGIFRTKQNFIGTTGGSHEITYVPPIHEDIKKLIDNLLRYVRNPNDDHRPLVRAAIIHAQFETIHPFMDGNGRVGRMLIPLYLYYTKQIELPCFFVSEALERDKMKYYLLLNETRNNNWCEWIKFFLLSVTSQCEKYINIISKINILYDKHLSQACQLVSSGKMTNVINLLYKYPVINATTIEEETSMPKTSINRYLTMLEDARILFSDKKSRNRTYFYYDLLNILRE